jgi:uncharacterized membrane protein YjfL (UPF0719 family)
MKNKNSNSDFQDFMSNSDTKAPQALSQNILLNVKNKLNPTKKNVFFKLLAIQAFIGFITMLFCPQFELSLTNNYDIFHYFHRTFGHYGCMAVCGSVFLGSGAIFASMILSKEELFVIKETKYLFNFAISGLAVGLFLILGAKVYLDLTLIWAGSGIVLSIIVFEISRAIKTLEA